MAIKRLKSNISLLILLFLMSTEIAVAFGFTDYGNKYFFSADIIKYNKDEEFISADGNIKIIIDEFIITADYIKYDLRQDQVWAEGNVIIRENKDKIILAEKIVFKEKLKSGIIADFIIRFNQENTILASKLATRISKNHFKLERSTFTPCLVTCNNKPTWQVSAKKADLNFDQQKITYRNLFFEVYGVPVLYIPYFSHPTPNAKAQSGLLTPSLKNNHFVVPLYIRAKPNMDFTLSPKIAKNNSIFEFQGRHKLANGYYQIDGNYGNVVHKNKNVNSAYLSSHGSFFSENIKYGFDIESASDKLYLKNYLDKQQPYLASKIYLNKIQKYDYSILEIMNFQNLNNTNSTDINPLILPKIITKNIINLSDRGDTDLIIKSNVINYIESAKKVNRGSLEFSLVNNIVSSYGHMFSQTLQIRGDLYIVQESPKKDIVLSSRVIPELHNMWRYPLIKYSDLYSINIEPMILAIIGATDQINNRKFHQVDPNKLNISANNLFIANHYSGLDYHESGNRINYGLNIASVIADNYYEIFVGRFLYNKNAGINQKGNIGKFSVKIHNTINLSYTYKYDAHFNPIKDELAIALKHNNIQVNTSLVKLSNLKKYYFIEGLDSIDNKILQINLGIDYKISSNWSVQYGERIDLSNRIRPLQRTIKMTYAEDCASVAIELHDNYTFDALRGIKRIHNKSVLVGLKIINM